MEKKRGREDDLKWEGRGKGRKEKLMEREKKYYKKKGDRKGHWKRRCWEGKIRGD